MHLGKIISMNIFDRIFNKIVSHKVNNIVFSRDVAKKMPIYCSWHVRWSGIKRGCIQIEGNEIYKGMLQIGHDRIATGLLGGKKSSVIFEGNGHLVFKGKADLSQGISVHVMNNAEIIIGSGIYTNGYCTIRCSKKIEIGKDNMWGWNVFVVDTDGHPIYDSEHNISNNNEEIIIGNDVWLGADSRVLKGAILPDGCILGMGSVATRKEETQNAIMVGSPAKVVKTGISWNRGEFPM